MSKETTSTPAPEKVAQTELPIASTPTATEAAPAKAKAASKKTEKPEAAAAVASSAPETKPARKERTGEVLASKMQKTIVVRVERRVPHPKFKKIVRVHKKFYAHDEKNEAQPGDRVLIRETRPMSKLKRWELVSVIKH
jgi:small subunit ribosomal protein S17